MISDSSKVAGIQVDEFEVGGVKRYVKDGCIRLADGTIAGSTCTMLNGVRNLLHIGIPMEDVAKIASYTPARSIGMENELGSIEVGKYADLVALDGDLQVAFTFINGKCAYKRG